MERLELHVLLCSRDVELLVNTQKLWRYYFSLDYDLIIHDDGSLSEELISTLETKLNSCRVIRRSWADESIKSFLTNYENSFHFRTSEHHTIFKIKLFDPFFFSESKNLMVVDSDILLCKHPLELEKLINENRGCYLRDSWTSYCVPFRNEDRDTTIKRFINAGFVYYPSLKNFSMDYIEECLSILYNNGSRGATHPFLEQTCVAYQITKQKNRFTQLSHPEYCVGSMGKFVPNHNKTMLHLTSSPLSGKFRQQHLNFELSKISLSKN